MKRFIPLLLLWGCAAPAHERGPERDDWRAEKDARIAQLEASLASEKGFSQKVREQIALGDAELETKSLRLALLETEAKKHAQEVARLQERINILDTENSSKAARINDLIRQLDFSNALLVKMEGDLKGLSERVEGQVRQVLQRLEKKDK